MHPPGRAASSFSLVTPSWLLAVEQPLDKDAKERLAMVRAEDQGIDLVPCLLRFSPRTTATGLHRRPDRNLLGFRVAEDADASSS